jgi:hypothetical protein
MVIKTNESVACKLNAIKICSQGAKVQNYGNDLNQCLYEETKKCVEKDPLSLPTKTGVKTVDNAMFKILSWEDSNLSNPFIKIAMLGLAGYGIYALAAK